MHKEVTRPKLWIADFKKELPDFINRPVVSPLHYGETIEICFVKGIDGETIINGKRFEYQYKNVFFIPPRYLHTSIYRKGGRKTGDMICAFHLNVDALLPFIDLNKILFKDDKTLFDLAFRFDNYDSAWEIVQLIIDENRSFISRIIDTLKLFELFASEKKADGSVVEYSKVTIEMINFVENNYHKKITLQHASQHFGFSAQYFCKWCKKLIGVSFNEFLNAVRITHARGFLLGGYSIDEVADKCGFSDPSYFCKVFKKYVNVTPKTYALNNMKN